MRKIWDIHGGVHPPENKNQTNQSPIARIPLPEELVIPLNQHIGAPAILTVSAGERVLKGQCIAEPQGYVSTAIHAPTSGKITSIESRPLNHASGLEGLCAVIKPDGKEEWTERKALPEWESEKKTVLIEHIRQSGIAGMGGAGFPTSVKLSPRADQKIHTLIINGTECEPYITADDMLMREHAEDIISGVEILAHILGGPESILIGVEDNKPEAAEAMKRAAASSSKAIEVVTFPTKYPSGGEKQLIQILTGEEVPSGKLPADIGIVLQNVGTACAVHKAVINGEPLTERITTVVGEALSTQQNISTLIGTPVKHILQHHGFKESDCARVVIGGPMMGYAITKLEAPIVKTTNCILVPSTQEMPEAAPQQACIRCGMCAEACPVSLLPQQLYWFSRSENFEHLRSHNLFDCIECGACSYVCPSNIPLVQYYRASKGAIRHHDEEKRKAEYSRQRFEFRKARIEKAEAEKEAKRAARKKAAEAAKAKLAQDVKEKPSNTPVSQAKSGKTTSSDKPADPSKTLAKLERALSSAQNRLDRANKALAEAKSEGQETNRIETLGARVKEAEKKVSDAQTRIDEFNVENEPNAKHATNSSTTAAITEKLNANPVEKAEKSIATLTQRIQTARDKVREAEENQAPTLEALKKGVEKLDAKLQLAQQELETLKSETQSNKAQGKEPDQSQNATREMSAAEAAIAKAQAKAEAQALMSDEEKHIAQITSLKKRLEKAKARLAKAESEQDENVTAFKGSVEKLSAKLAELEKNTRSS